ncbi:MAG: POT family MFS transporter, partial [Bauldia sp.]
MAETKFLTAPVKTDKMPAGIPYIIGNEAAERFCFYGMRAILVVYMTQYLLSPAGGLDVMTESEANENYHLFVSLNYFLPVFGALLASFALSRTKRLKAMLRELFAAHRHLAIAWGALFILA